MTSSPSPELPRPKVIYLDQNKWIELAQAVKSPKEYPAARRVMEVLCAQVEAGSIRLPVTSSNIYETHKVNRQEQRFDLAYTQATLSKGEVFRGFHRRLEVEISRILSKLYHLPWIEPSPDWVLSKIFFEATVEANDPRLGHKIPHRFVESIRAEPQRALLHYLMNTPEPERKQAVRKFTEGCEALRLRIEERRARHKSESVSMRRKIYNVLLVLGEQEVMIATAARLGLPWACFMDNGGTTMRAVVRETPALLIEREISLKLEAQNRPIHPNDMRDMRTFSTVLPYSDVVIAEKPFTNLARQAGLQTHFGVRLETDLQALKDVL